MFFSVSNFDRTTRRALVRVRLITRRALKRLKAAGALVSLYLPGMKALSEARSTAEVAMIEARAAHARLRDAIDMLPEGILFLDQEGRYILWNRQYEEFYKESADLFVVGERFEDQLRKGVYRGQYPEAAGREEAWLAERFAKLRNPGPRHEQPLADGRVILIEERRTSDGGLIGIRLDITEMKQREASFRLLFDANPVPMFVLMRETQAIIALNDAAISHYGYTKADALRLRLRDLHATQDHIEIENLQSVFEDRHAGRTWRHARRDGSQIDVAMYASPLTYGGHNAVLIAAVDISERKRAEQRLAFWTDHDALTALPNRTLLRRRIEDAFEDQQKNGNGFAIFCIDLDNFKAINDVLGDSGGDALLQQLATRLSHAVSEADTVARLGGDEFAILRSGIADPGAAGMFAESLLAKLETAYEVNGQKCQIGASVGIALAPGDGEDADRLLKNADTALYRAKAESKCTYRFFEAEMDIRVQARLRLEMELRTALRENHLQVHYQPLIDLSTGDVAGFEALLRWPHPERGFVSPAEFIPLAEQVGLIGPIGDYVLHRACADAAAWPKNVKVAVNLSPLQFRSGNVLMMVASALQESGLAAERLELEITETLLLESLDHVLVTLHALRAQGVKISMDDFGTGYSSLGYLRKFPLDKIKIDRSFVRELGADRHAQAIVRAILSLGSSLGMTITAEGIETAQDLAYLKGEGCNQGQGFLFSKARPQAEIMQLLDSGQFSQAA